MRESRTLGPHSFADPCTTSCERVFQKSPSEKASEVFLPAPVQACKIASRHLGFREKGGRGIRKEEDGGSEFVSKESFSRVLKMNG